MGDGVLPGEAGFIVDLAQRSRQRGGPAEVGDCREGERYQNADNHQDGQQLDQREAETAADRATTSPSLTVSYQDVIQSFALVWVPYGPCGPNDHTTTEFVTHPENDPVPTGVTAELLTVLARLVHVLS